MEEGREEKRIFKVVHPALWVPVSWCSSCALSEPPLVSPAHLPTSHCAAQTAATEWQPLLCTHTDTLKCVVTLCTMLNMPNTVKRVSGVITADTPTAVSTHTLGLSLLFPKYYLIFHSEFPKLLLYYSLRVDPLFHKILLTVSQTWPKQTRQKYTLQKSYTKIHKILKL